MRTGSPKISIISPTARESDALVGLGENIYSPLFTSLRNQTFRDFELVVVDSLFEKRSDLFAKLTRRHGSPGFEIKHGPPRECIWHEIGAWALVNSLNTALVMASGELIVRVDDCIRLRDEDHLQRIWDWYSDEDRWVWGMFKRIVPESDVEKNVSPHIGEDAKKREDQDRLMEQPEYTEDGYRIKGIDTRWRTVEEAGGVCQPYPNWMYGHSAAPLEAWLDVNGWDSNLDSSKSLEDVDGGMRLCASGRQGHMLMDTEIWVESFEHYPVSSDVVFYKGKKGKVNGSLLRFNERHLRTVVNHPIAPQYYDEIKRDILTSGDYNNNPNQYDLDEAFDFWAEHQEDYDLRELRERVHPIFR